MKRNSFIFLNMTQFFSALNDNIYKLLLVFQLVAILGVQQSGTILSLAGAIFVLPFLLFAALSGSLSDKFSKRSIIVITRILELFIVALGVLSFFLKSIILGYSVLFLMATQSALFSPAKYGIIPEILKKEEISRYNGILTATTYLAIILGTFFASFLAEITGKNFLLASFFCLLIAILGVCFSFGIEKTKAQASYKKVSANLFIDLFKTIQEARKIRYLLGTIIFGAYFLFLGAFVQLNIIPFAFQSLHLSEIQGGYLFIMTAIGIGLGSFLAGKISGNQVELGLVPLSTLLIALVLCALYLFQYSFITVSLLLILLGFCGGFYIVPIDAFIQWASPKANRGQNLAAANFLNFIGVIIASLFIFLIGLFHLTAAQGFMVLSWLTIGLGLSLIYIMGDQLVRFFLIKIIRPFLHLQVRGETETQESIPIIFCAERKTWIDTLLMMIILPRFVRIIVPIDQRFKKTRSFLYRAMSIHPVEEPLFIVEVLEEITQEIGLGHSICLMKTPYLAFPWDKLQLNVNTIDIKIEAPTRIGNLFSFPLKATLTKGIIRFPS